MSKPTPGPWYVGLDEEGGPMVIADSVTLPIVAECPGDGGEANARLLSKAWLLPEMVEALRDVLEDWDNCTVAFDRCRSVLAKYEAE
jgi:hypothetical protein